MESVIIIGGGVGGLSCQNALLDYGIRSLLLEAGEIGTPKMCGEFIAPHAVQQLARWEIDAYPISAAHFFAGTKQFKLRFREKAGALARACAEKSLAKRAIEQGASIQEKTRVMTYHLANDNQPHSFTLSTQESIQSTTVFLATGKLDQKTVLKPAYLGIKMRLPFIVEPETLLMFSLPDAYLGIVPLSETESNCTCLIKQSFAMQFDKASQAFEYLLNTHSFLRTLFDSHDLQSSWFEAKAPSFRLINRPFLKNVYFIGDAVASLPPAIGSGFAHAIESACTAVQRYNANQFYRDQQTKQKFYLGSLFHQFLLRPSLAKYLFSLLEKNPSLCEYFLMRLGY